METASIIILNVSFWLLMLSLYFYKHTKNVNKRFHEEIHLVSKNPFHFELPVSKRAYDAVLKKCYLIHRDTAGPKVQKILSDIIDAAIFHEENTEKMKTPKGLVKIWR